jgi:hypothetical protein
MAFPAGTALAAVACGGSAAAWAGAPLAGRLAARPLAAVGDLACRGSAGVIFGCTAAGGVSAMAVAGLAAMPVEAGAMLATAGVAAACAPGTVAGGLAARLGDGSWPAEAASGVVLAGMVVESGIAIRADTLPALATAAGEAGCVAGAAVAGVARGAVGTVPACACPAPGFAGTAGDRLAAGTCAASWLPAAPALPEPSGGGAAEAATGAAPAASPAWAAPVAGTTATDAGDDPSISIGLDAAGGATEAAATCAWLANAGGCEAAVGLAACGNAADGSDGVCDPSLCCADGAACPGATFLRSEAPDAEETCGEASVSGTT